jgi:aryl-alcohol dehydrogenase-like predicted oxidoreductase
MEFIKKLGFGTWQIAGENLVDGENIAWDNIDPEYSKSLLKFAYDNGIRFFDTSNGYGNGKSESYIGESISNLEGSQICTKFGWIKKRGNLVSDFSEYNAEKSLEESLKRLNRSSVEYYLFHTPKPEEINSKNIRALENLKSKGLIKEFGISCTTLEPYKEFFNVVDKFECAYNPIFPHNEKYFNHKDLQGKIFIRSIFASGLLTRESEDYVDRKFYSTKVVEESNIYNIENQNIEKRILGIIDSVNSLENVSHIIIGFRKENQLKNILKYEDFKLSYK